MTTATLPTETVPLGAVTLHPDNPNVGDVDSLADSLARYGQWRPAVVQRSTGRVLIGNTMVRAMQALGWQELAVHYRDCDDDDARRILLRDNKERDRARYDERELADLLASLDDLDGSGWQPDELDDLLAKLEEISPGTAADPTALIPGDTNVRQTPNYSEYQAAYGDRATRFFALIYPLGQYAWVEDKLTKLAAEFGYDNNSDTLLRLLADRLGEEAPPAE